MTSGYGYWRFSMCRPRAEAKQSKTPVSVASRIVRVVEMSVCVSIDVAIWKSRGINRLHTAPFVGSRCLFVRGIIPDRRMCIASQ